MTSKNLIARLIQLLFVAYPSLERRVNLSLDDVIVAIQVLTAKIQIQGHWIYSSLMDLAFPAKSIDIEKFDRKVGLDFTAFSSLENLLRVMCDGLRWKLRKPLDIMSMIHSSRIISISGKESSPNCGNSKLILNFAATIHTLWIRRTSQVLTIKRIVHGIIIYSSSKREKNMSHSKIHQNRCPLELDCKIDLPSFCFVPCHDGLIS